MIYFIEERGNLSKLREEMLQNTILLLDILRERKIISEKISALKLEYGMEIRDRRREKEVIEKLSVKDPIIKRLLNLLFEYSIQIQNPLSDSIKWKELNISGETFSMITGERDYILLLAGLCLGKIGGSAYTNKALPEPLELGLILSGMHIIIGEGIGETLKVYVNKRILHNDPFIFNDGNRTFFGVPIEMKANLGMYDVEFI